MTDERYLEWKSDIAAARAEGDTKKLNSLQLDYNLELGECLAHQSQRTKDIKDDLVAVKKEIGNVGKDVGTLAGRVDDLETSMTSMANSVSSLAKSVNDLVTYRNGLSLKAEGARAAGRLVSAIACGIAIVTGWGYAIYQALKSSN